MALGMTAVILTGGIDLSVGSIMGLVGVVCGLVLQAGQHWAVAIAAGLLAGAATGAVNGVLIAYVGLPSFVVTLGMLSIARSLAIVLSQNKIIYQLGPWRDTFDAIGGGDILGIANPVWLLLIMTLIFGYRAQLHAPGAGISSPSAATRMRRASPACRSSASSSRPISSLGYHGRDRLGDHRRLARLRDQCARHGL